jgi:hypothetical protein
MNYFGTSLTSHGHYFFKLRGDQMNDIGLSFPKGEGIPIMKYKEWPFNPEKMPDSRMKGDAEYYQINGYSIYAICGSCKDERGGTKSVFFTTETLTKEELKDKILSIPIAKSIIDQMPFKVMW